MASLAGLNRDLEISPWKIQAVGIHLAACPGFLCPQSCMRLHFMAHLGITIWKLNFLPSCSREAGLQTSLMRSHTGATVAILWVLADRREEEAYIFWFFTLSFPLCSDLGRLVFLAVSFKFQIKLWQWALSFQGMLFHIFRGPDKDHQGFSAKQFITTPGLRHDVISQPCDGSLICFMPFFFSFRAWEANWGQPSFRTSTVWH